MLPYGRKLLLLNMLGTHTIADSLKRLLQERDAADRLYNRALTALDEAIPGVPPVGGDPISFDEHQITSLNGKWNVLAGEPGPTGGRLRGRFRAAVWHVVGPLFQRQQEFNSAVVDHINRNVRHHREAAQSLGELSRSLRQHIQELAVFHTRLIVFLQQITSYVDTRDRDVAGIRLPLAAGISTVGDELHKRFEVIGLLQQATLSMKRELERLAAAGGAGRAPEAPAEASELDAFKYVGFEDQYRGSRDDVRDKLTPYVAYFEGASEVLDVGCGRGEFLELLRERGIAARGIDLNGDMIELCLSAGLQAEKHDALAYLGSLPDKSLGGIFSSQLIEHLEPGYLMRLMEAMFHALKPGGTIVLETINPASWAAFFSAYIRDITHAQPIHPDTLRFLVSASGFSNATIRYSAPFADAEKLQMAYPAGGDEVSEALARVIAASNANAEKLNNLLFTHRDFAVIAERIG